MDLFNWYVSSDQRGVLMLSGDVSIKTLRHVEYIIEKTNYTNKTIIAKRDKLYCMTHGCEGRFMKFIQAPIVHYDAPSGLMHCKNNTCYRLVNMDAFFFTDEERKQKQMKLILSNYTLAGE